MAEIPVNGNWFYGITLFLSLLQELLEVIYILN